MWNFLKRFTGAPSDPGEVDLATATTDELVAANQALGRAADAIRERRKAINAAIAHRLTPADATVPGQTIDVKAEV